MIWGRGNALYGIKQGVDLIVTPPSLVEKPMRSKTYKIQMKKLAGNKKL